MHKIKTDYKHVTRNRACVAFIVHNTGDTDLDDIVRYYTHSSKGIAPHYLIDYNGSVFCFVSENRVAYHAGYSAAKRDREEYEQGWDHWSRLRSGTPYATWDRRWRSGTGDPGKDTGPRKQGLQSPLEHVCGDSPNGMSIGIELRAPKRYDQPDVFTDEQYASLAARIHESAMSHSIPIDRNHVLGHYDVNPLGRGDKRGDWDPGEGFNWDRLLIACNDAT